MSNRECFPCTACCEGWLTSKKLKMSPGKPCQHRTPEGCGIYQDRPEKPCREFRCGWLDHSGGMPDDFRPDLCGAIVLFDRKWNSWSVVKAVPTGEEIPEETLEWLKAYAVEHKIPLLFEKRLLKDGQFHGLKKLGYGPPAFLRDVELAIGPDDIFNL